MIIRNATIFDHTGILTCIIKWLDECSIGFPRVNTAIAEWINQVIINGYCIVAEEDGVIVGCCGMTYTHFPWNDKVAILNSEWFHVDKEFRHSGTARKMIDEIKGFASDRNLPVIMGISNGVDTEKKKRFLQITGATHVGGNFIYGLGEK